MLRWDLIKYEYCCLNFSCDIAEALASRVSAKWQTCWSNKKCYCISTKCGDTRTSTQFFLTFPKQIATAGKSSAVCYLYPVWMNSFFVWLFKASMSVSVEAPTGSLKTTYSALVNVTNDVPEQVLVCPEEIQDFHRSSVSPAERLFRKKKKKKLLTLEEKPGFLFELWQVLEDMSNIKSWSALKAVCGQGVLTFVCVEQLWIVCRYRAEETRRCLSSRRACYEIHAFVNRLEEIKTAPDDMPHML